MDYLEKLFIFTLVLSFLTMAFMFGLYFDVGDMISGKISGATAFRTAMAESAVALLEYGNRPKESSRSERTQRGYVDRSEDYGMPAQMDGFVESHGKAIDRSVVVDMKRNELRRLGFTHEGFIEMESLKKNRNRYLETMRAVGQYLAANDYEGAVDEIRSAIEATNKKNLYVLRDLWARLINVYYKSRKFEAARKASYRYVAYEEKILRNKEGARIPVNQSDWKRIQELKSSIEPYYKKLKEGELPRERAAPKGKRLSEAHKQLLESYRRGEISRDEYENLKAEYGI